jgi:hypothetical protein
VRREQVLLEIEVPAFRLVFEQGPLALQPRVSQFVRASM